ncbi:hypothetical protein [Companilactobacillus ginsenosidimutans]|uniref:Peptidase M10 metallopeptidase domain-containing protein n=1 Tax=Companilactobacillus ginsenosidimutans TaxID=1007676 RepID=A0A0H4QJ02_9LACO|nr:hypothetical protein [Companilactobacillus ginsenosidimutans]AKP67897.1 hypothetical protein ABM34_10390 [Companilactobacillus ginsenosidimutans]
MKQIKITLCGMFTIAITLLTFIMFENTANAVEIKSDQGPYVYIPENYFSHKVNDADIQHYQAICDHVQYYLQHPDEVITDPATRNELGATTMSQHIESLYKGRSAYGFATDGSVEVTHSKSKADIVKFIQDRYSDAYSLTMIRMNGGLNINGFNPDGSSTGPIHFTNVTMNSMVKPSDITVYDGTNSPSAHKAITIAFTHWSRIPYFNFRFVDNPAEARIIISGFDKDTKPEQGTEGLFVPLTYCYTEIQGHIYIKPELLHRDWRYASLDHVIMHEMGHALGRVDLYN